MRRLMAVIVALLLVSACGGSGSDKEEVPMGERPSMETVLAEYEAMRVEIVEGLVAQLGPRSWNVSANSPEFGTAGCKDSDVGEIAFPGLVSMRGSWDAGDLDQVAQIVQGIGREHGFTDVVTLIDKPGDIKFDGYDRFGGQDSFGSAKNTVLGVMTGCHVWEGERVHEAPFPRA